MPWLWLAFAVKGSATQAALHNLYHGDNKASDELEYTVLEEAKKGFLGIGSTDAKILVKVVPGVREATEEFLRTFLKNAKILEQCFSQFTELQVS